MAQQTKAYLKARFATGNKPTAQDFADLIDSAVFLSDAEAVNAGVIDTRINAYDTAQKAQSGEPVVTTVGDALYALRAFNALGSVQQEIEAAGGEITWGGISNKPESAQVAWDEYNFTLDLYQQPGISSYESISAAQIVADCAPANIKAAIAGKKWVILDISITNVPIVMANSSALTYPVSRLRHVKIGVNPRIVFPG